MSMMFMDADAADKKADGTDDGNQKRHGRGNLTKLIGDLLRAGNSKIIRFTVRHVPAAPQHAADLISASDMWPA